MRAAERCSARRRTGLSPTPTGPARSVLLTWHGHEAALHRASDPADPNDDYRCEYRVVHPGDGVRWLSVVGRAVFAPAPDLSGGRLLLRLLGTARDVSAAHRSDQERQRSAALLRTIIETASGLIYAKDRQGRMLLADQATLDVVGKPWAEVDGCTDVETLDDPIQGEAVMANDRRLLESGIAEEFEEVVGAIGGTQRIWASSKTPMRDDSGVVIGLVGVSIEITSGSAPKHCCCA